MPTRRPPVFVIYGRPNLEPLDFPLVVQGGDGAFAAAVESSYSLFAPGAPPQQYRDGERLAQQQHTRPPWSIHASLIFRVPRSLGSLSRQRGNENVTFAFNDDQLSPLIIGYGDGELLQMRLKTHPRRFCRTTITLFAWNQPTPASSYKRV